MTNITLKAKLRAYSKSPFFDDYVRGVNIIDGEVHKLEPNTLYGYKDGRWESIFIGDISAVSERFDKVENGIQSLKVNNDSLLELINRLGISFDYENNTLIYTNSLGVPYKVQLLVRADNETIRYNEYNRLETIYRPDLKTIKNIDGDNIQRVESIYAIKPIQVGDQTSYEEKYITGTEISNFIESADKNFSYFSDLMDKLSLYVRGKDTKIYSLDPIDLSTYYARQESGDITTEELQIQILQSLSNAAYDLLNIESERVDLIPIGVKIIDRYKGNLWIYSKDEDELTPHYSWQNVGSDLVVLATNTGVQGVVTGVSWDRHDDIYDDSWQEDKAYLKAHIDNEEIIVDDLGNKYYKTNIDTPPTVTINGLSNRLQDLDSTKVEKIDNKLNCHDVVYIQQGRTSGYELQHNDVSYLSVSDGYDPDSQSIEHLSGSIVKRTVDGTIITNNPTSDYESLNVIWFNQKLQDMKLCINNLERKTYTTSFINNDGDVTSTF